MGLHIDFTCFYVALLMLSFASLSFNFNSAKISLAFLILSLFRVTTLYKEQTLIGVALGSY